jgi:ATP-dependent DNA helicase RecQ
VQEAIAFLCRSDLPIEPRAHWQAGALPTYGWGGSIAKDQRAEPGRALCILGDAGWGNLVRRGKYQDGKFADELVEALAGLVRGWRPTPPPTWVTSVPSLTHPGLVPDLASGLARRLSLPFVPAVRKVRQTRPQKEMENSWHQAHNLDGAFVIDSW